MTNTQSDLPSGYRWANEDERDRSDAVLVGEKRAVPIKAVSIWVRMNTLPYLTCKVTI